MKILRWLPAFLICSFIFSQSLLTGTQSSGFSSRITEWFVPIFFFVEKETLHFFVRKAAHFSEYFALGCAIVYGMNHKKQPVVFFLLAIMIPLCDEGIQSFTAGRSAQLTDCLIDACGMSAAWILTLWIHILQGGKHNEHLES